MNLSLKMARRWQFQQEKNCPREAAVQHRSFERKTKQSSPGDRPYSVDKHPGVRSTVVPCKMYWAKMPARLSARGGRGLQFWFQYFIVRSRRVFQLAGKGLSVDSGKPAEVLTNYSLPCVDMGCRNKINLPPHSEETFPRVFFEDFLKASICSMSQPQTNAAPPPRNTILMLARITLP